MGPHLLPSVAYRDGDSELPYPIVNVAPTLGQHNQEVLREVLGLSEAEIADLARSEIIGTEATLPKPKKKKTEGKAASAAS